MDHTAGEMYLFAWYVSDAELDALISLVHLKTGVIAVVVGQRHEIVTLLAVMTEERAGIALCVRAVAVTVEISAKGSESIKILCKRINIELGNLLFVLFELEQILLLAVEGICKLKNSILCDKLYGVLGRRGKIANLVIISTDDIEQILRAVEKKKGALVGNDLDLGLLTHRNNGGNHTVICYCRKHFLAHSLMLLYQLYHYISSKSIIMRNHKQKLII